MDIQKDVPKKIKVAKLYSNKKNLPKKIEEETIDVSTIDEPILEDVVSKDQSHNDADIFSEDASERLIEEDFDSVSEDEYIDIPKSPKTKKTKNTLSRKSVKSTKIPKGVKDVKEEKSTKESKVVKVSKQERSKKSKPSMYQKGMTIASYTLASLVLFGGLGWGGTLAWEHYVDIPQTAGERKEQELASLVQSLKEHIIVPTESIPPSLYTVSNADVLKATQPFFKDVENGDKVALYNESGKVIIYRASDDLIVNMGPINSYENRKQEDESKVEASIGVASSSVATSSTKSGSTTSSQLTSSRSGSSTRSVSTSSQIVSTGTSSKQKASSTNP